MLGSSHEFVNRDLIDPRPCECLDCQRTDHRDRQQYIHWYNQDVNDNAEWKEEATPYQKG